MTTRIPPLPLCEWTQQQWDALQGRLPRADGYMDRDGQPPALPPMLGLLARHPRLGGSFLAFSASFLDGALLPGRLRELVVLRVAARLDNTYLVDQHTSMAAREGLTPEEISAARAGTWPADGPGLDGAVITMVDELVDGHAVTDPTWAALSGPLDQETLLELVFLASTYICLALVLNSVGLESTPVGGPR